MRPTDIFIINVTILFKPHPQIKGLKDFIITYILVGESLYHYIITSIFLPPHTEVAISTFCFISTIISQHNVHPFGDDRIAIKTAMRFNIPHAKIISTLNVTQTQNFYARNAHIQKKECGSKSLIRTPQRKALKDWLEQSSSHKRISFRYTLSAASDLGLEGVGKKTLKTVFRTLRYMRRTSIKKGFSDLPEYRIARVEFAREGITWPRDGLVDRIFSD